VAKTERDHSGSTAHLQSSATYGRASTSHESPRAKTNVSTKSSTPMVRSSKKTGTISVRVIPTPRRGSGTDSNS